MAHAHYARALKYLRKAAEEKPYVNCSAMDMAVIEVRLDYLAGECCWSIFECGSVAVRFC